MDVRTHVPAGARRATREGVEPLGIGSVEMIHPAARSVKCKSESAGLAAQAKAAEQRALANAAWHRERAGRYLAWPDLPWCAAQYAGHLAEAEFQERLAARHAAVRAALQGVRP